MASEAFYRNAAKAAWVAPLIAIVLNYTSNADPAMAHAPKYQFVHGALATLLILTGLVSGIVALYGARTHRHAGIIVPAVVGDMRKLQSVTFRMNGEEITIQGSFLSAEQKLAMGAGN